MGLDVTEIISSLFPGKRAQKVFLFGQTVMAATPVESIRVGGGEGGWRRRAVLCLCFQRTVKSTGGQRCLRGSAVTTHPVSLLQTPPHLPHPPAPPPPTHSNLLSGCMQWWCRTEPHPLAIAHHRAHLWAKDRNPVGLLLTLRLTLRLTLQVISSVSCKKPGLSNHTVISAE